MMQNPGDPNALHDKEPHDEVTTDPVHSGQESSRETESAEIAAEHVATPPEPEVEIAPAVAPEVQNKSSGKAGSAAIGGVFGALLASVVFVGAPFVVPNILPGFLAGVLPKTSPDPAISARFSALDGKVAALDAALKALPSPADSFAKLDEQIKKALEAAPANPLAATSDTSSVGQTGLEARLAKLEASIAAPKSEARVTAEPDAAPKSSGNAAALAIVADVLNQTIAREASFATPLSAAESLGADATKIAVLKPFADKGLPTNPALAGSFMALAPSLLKDEQAPPAGFMDRIMSSASKLVKIRTGVEPVGDDPASLVARIAHLGARGKWPDALVLADKLPPAAKEKLSGWMKLVQNRLAAEAAAQGLLDDALNLIAKNLVAKPKN